MSTTFGFTEEIYQKINLTTYLLLDLLMTLGLLNITLLWFTVNVTMEGNTT